jgi:hypothetical protein
LVLEKKKTPSFSFIFKFLFEGRRWRHKSVVAFFVLLFFVVNKDDNNKLTVVPKFSSPTNLLHFILCSLHRQSLKREGIRGRAKVVVKRKRLKQKGKSEKAEAWTKSERAKQELEGELPPFLWFSFVVFLCVLSTLCLRKRKRRQCAIVFFCGVITKKGNCSLLSLPFSLCLRRKRWWQCAIVFFCGVVVWGVVALYVWETCYCLLLWWCFSKKGDDNLLPSLSSLVMLKWRRLLPSSLLKKKNMTIMCCRLFLWCCCSEEGDDNKLWSLLCAQC